MPDDVTTLFLCGDVMLGRGIDQVLPHPGDPTLWESHVRDARDYVALAERANGPIPRAVGVDWPWGDALQVLDEAAPDARIVNLETAVTRSDDVATSKGVHYRMEPDNLPSLAMARPDACVLANNHVLDFGRSGLAETLDVLGDAGLPVVGAGRDVVAAGAPATVPVGDDGRILVFGVGAATSGIPGEWAASDDLRLVFLASMSRATGALVGLRMVPLQARRLRLDRASSADAGWLQHTLDRISRPFGSRVGLGPTQDLVVTPDRPASRPGRTAAPSSH